MKYKKIFIIAGHSETDPGAIAKDGTTEREIVKEISYYVSEILYEKAISIGIEPSRDLGSKIKTINNLCEKFKLDHENSLLVSIHADWRGASEGVCGYHYAGSYESKKFSETIISEVAKVGERMVKFNRADTHSRHGRLGIIRDTEPLAALIEVGVLKIDNNETDGLELIKSKEGQKKIAFAIVKAIERFTGWETTKEEEKTTAPPKELHSKEEQKAIDLVLVSNSMAWYHLSGEKRKAVEECSKIIRK